MKVKTTAVIVAVICLVAFTGGFYIYQLQKNNINSGSIVATNGNDSKPSNKPISVTNYDMVWTGMITYKLIQNSTTLNVTKGSSVYGNFPMNIFDSAPLKFFVDDDPAKLNLTKSVIPSEISVSMSIYGKQYQPERLSVIEGTDYSKNSFIPTIRGQTSVLYSISVSNNVPTGTYHLNFECQSFLSKPSLIPGSVDYRIGKVPVITDKTNSSDLRIDQVDYYKVILNVR